MPLNINPLNTETVNNILSGTIDGAYVGVVFSVQQKILCNYYGPVLGITQNIKLLETQDTVAVLSIEQKIISKQPQAPVYQITQMIINP